MGLSSPLTYQYRTDALARDCKNWHPNQDCRQRFCVIDLAGTGPRIGYKKSVRRKILRALLWMGLTSLRALYSKGGVTPGPKHRDAARSHANSFQIPACQIETSGPYEPAVGLQDSSRKVAGCDTFSRSSFPLASMSFEAGGGAQTEHASRLLHLSFRIVGQAIAEQAGIIGYWIC